MDKLTEWNNAGEKLKQHVPNNDEVLHSWQTQLEEFSQDLPLLLQLSSDALKVINPCRTVCTKRFWFQSQIQVLCVNNKQQRKNTDNNKEQRKEVGELETE